MSMRRCGSAIRTPAVHAVRRYQWTRREFVPIIDAGVGGLDAAAAKGADRTGATLAPNASATTTASPSPLLDLVGAHFTDMDFAFGYGSGVIKQRGYDATQRRQSPPQIDVIIAVRDSYQWHRANLQLNASHYLSLRYGGATVVLHIQQYGAGVYFNPYVRLEGNVVKYGVVLRQELLHDLCHWSTLYLAGRLQKPVQFLAAAAADAAMRAAMQYNLQLALTLAVVLSSADAKPRLLYETVTSLLYLGDLRMLIGGENRNKVANIVLKQRARFDEIYAPFLQPLYDQKIVSPALGHVSPLSAADVADAVSVLPRGFRHRLGPLTGREDAATLHRRLATTVGAIVRYPSVVQTAKGVATAGVVKSVRYAWEKKRKHWASSQ